MPARLKLATGSRKKSPFATVEEGLAALRAGKMIVVVDDGDHSLVEPRAPYHHARDVALLRAQHDDLGLLVMGQAVTPEAERLVETGWASSIAAQRPNTPTAPTSWASVW